MNDDISFVLGSAFSCDGQTFVSDITSSSQWSSVANDNSFVFHQFKVRL